MIMKSVRMHTYMILGTSIDASKFYGHPNLDISELCTCQRYLRQDLDLFVNMGMYNAPCQQSQ